MADQAPLLISEAEAILIRLFSLAKDQIKLAWGFKPDLEKLCHKLEIIQVLLVDAKNRKITSEAMMVLLKNLKAATFDTENVLDELAYEDLRRKIEVQNHMRNKVYELQHVKDKEEAEKAKMLEKSNIQELQLHWDRDLGESDNNHEDVLEGLKPHQNVKGFEVINFGGRRLPSWMSIDAHSLQRLVKIKLRYCRLCEQVPMLGHLPHLEYLEMEALHSLKRIGHEFYGAAVTGVFPALINFKLDDMPELEEWLNVLSSSAAGVSTIEFFPRLQKLEIYDCPKLITLPAFKGSASLQQLSIFDCPELMCLPKGLLQPTLVDIWLYKCTKLNTPNPEALRSLTCLKDLRIRSCPNWGSCWEEGLFCPASLQRLDIGGFGEEYRDFPWPSRSAASPPWSHFTSLEYLTLRGWPEVKFLPDQLELLPALISLVIRNFSALESMPECLGNLSSLQSLHIVGCPLLEKRCEKGIGEDWHKIAHIPEIWIDWRKIE